MPGPFGPSPTDRAVAAQMKNAPIIQKTMFAKRTARECSANSPTLIQAAQAAWTQNNAHGRSQALFRLPLLTDCCSLPSAILRIQPRSQGGCAKLLANQMGDLQTLMDMSYVDNSCTIEDMGTIHGGSLSILTRFFGAGNFDIPFLGRKERLALGKYSSSLQ